MKTSRIALGAILMGLPCLAAGSPASALAIKPTFDSSVTSRSNAAQIETAFNTAAGLFDKAFANPATVNITVSFGSVAGAALGSGDVSGSTDNLSGPYSYASLATDLKAVAQANPKDATLASVVAHLSKTDPISAASFEIPYAEAKAIGLLPPSLPIADGYIGFSSTAAFDFNDADGVAAGQYDFEGAAEHEIEEVLGRTSGLESASPPWATPFDLFRYTASGKPSFSYSTAAYFSVNGGATDLGNFNNVAGGDRGDWATAANATDLQSAFLSTGRAYDVSTPDLTALEALGWGAFSAAGLTLSAGPSTLSGVGAASATPEPSTWIVLILGFGLTGAATRRRRAQANPGAALPA